MARSQLDMELYSMAREIDYWQYTLVGQFLGAKPSLIQVRDFVQKHWNHVSKPDVLYFKKGWFYFRFEKFEDMQTVMRGGCWNLNNSMLVLKTWHPNFRRELDFVSVVPVWILLMDLDPLFWSPKALSKISSKIGKPLYADPVITHKERLHFARVLVELDASKLVPEELLLHSPFGGSILERVVVEWMPYFCHHCKKLGHEQGNCRLLKKSELPKKGPVTKKTYVAVVQSHKPNREQTTRNLPAVTQDVTSEPMAPCSKEGPTILLLGTRQWVYRSPSDEQHFALKHNYNSHYNGRIWLLWKNSLVKVTVVSEASQWITVQIKYMTYFSGFITFVYGSNDGGPRMHLWNHLRNSQYNSPWLILGDFNCVRSVDERISDCSPVLSELDDFNSCLDDAGLDDFSTIGCYYTWTNKQNPNSRKWIKLDSVLCNMDWLSSFPSSFAQALPSGISDHSPLIVTTDPTIQSRPIPFQYLNYWGDDPLFQDTVAQIWSTKVSGTAMYQLVTHLKMLKPALKKLNVKKFRTFLLELKNSKINFIDVRLSSKSLPLIETCKKRKLT
ncbi:uncharacterized protein LOC141630522 [Silene latifolia]|uniref:uncharacterized protein LOC141630522 n=1 Tax=Silene latifolia TaxID=37657 RepID=UPI003D7761FE